MPDEQMPEQEIPELAVPEPDALNPEFRSGFVALVGRPNVGKSTILNSICGEKVTITSNKPQTTRHQVRGLLTTDEYQIVFVDTPGIGKPRSALGKKLNKTAMEAKGSVDVVCFVIDGRTGFGRGDEMLAQSLDPEKTVVVLNKIDGQKPEHIMAQLTKVSDLGASAYFPVSGWTGKGVPDLVKHLVDRIPKGPMWFPTDLVRETPDRLWVAELVREQLLRVLRDEVPHSVATRVVEWEWPRIRVEILVERNSQKGIVIGKGGQVLKEVGTRARKQLPEETFLELTVSVDPNWQQDPAGVERLGY